MFRYLQKLTWLNPFWGALPGHPLRIRNVKGEQRVRRKGWEGIVGGYKTTWSHPGSKQTEKLPHECGRRGIYTVRLLGTIMIKVHTSLEKSIFILYFFLIRETQ